MTLIPRKAGFLVGYKADNRLSVGFCERVIYLPKVCARVNFVTAAGWRMPMRADFFRALSCLTEASSVSAFAPFGWLWKTFFADWCFPLFTMDFLQFFVTAQV
jgi:hypothetical protein